MLSKTYTGIITAPTGGNGKYSYVSHRFFSGNCLPFDIRERLPLRQ